LCPNVSKVALDEEAAAAAAAAAVI